MTLFLLVTIAIAAVGILIYFVSLPGRYEVSRSLPMKVTRQQVSDKIRDFRSWQKWSPWLMHEPDTHLEFGDEPAELGGWYSWDGQRIGAGKLTHVKIDAPGRIEQRIEFVRPFKAQATVLWKLDEHDGQTDVTWVMRGSLPLFLRPMRPMMTQMIANDYDLGLAMLRGNLDPEAERPVIEFVGTEELELRTALTIAFKGGMDALVTAMQEGFSRLSAHVQGSGACIGGPPFSAYYKVDPKAMYFECDIAVPADEQVPPGDFERKVFGAGKHFKVTATGSYDFLKLVWHGAMGHIRLRKLKVDKRRPFLEVYENDPESVEKSNDIRTTLYIPIR